MTQKDDLAHKIGVSDFLITPSRPGSSLGDEKSSSKKNIPFFLQTITFVPTVCPHILFHEIIWRGLPVCRYTSRNSGMQQKFHFLPEKAVGAKSW